MLLKVRILLFFVVVSLLSCKKETERINAFVPKPSFRITGLRSYAFERNPIGQYGTISYLLQFVYESGVPRQLELSIENPTSFIRTRFTTTTGYPDFETELFVSDSVGPRGIYTLNLVATSKENGVQRFPFEVVIAGNDDWIPFFDGQHFTGVSYCPDEAFHYDVSVRQTAPNSDTLLFENMFGRNSVKMVPDRINKTLLVPPQIIENDTFSGVGKIVIDPYALSLAIKIDFVRATNGILQRCFYELKKP